MTSSDVRRQFIEFFVNKHGHTFVPSSSVVPHDDPTLLFTNAGMNQFKPIFLGEEKRSYSRAANTQKCIRAGGKHNDLDDVGRSRRHHTFFEMLGNWSFGDYFKAEAIEWAWELLSKEWRLDKDRLHVTCFEGGDGVPRDEEAAQLWRKIAGLDDSHIHYLGFKDNFWMMGDTGPCGPCTEIYIDRTPDKSGGKDVGGENPLVTEFWNLVFIQYNRYADGKLEPLPARHVDTGMGFERICQIIQGKTDNYAIDLWQPFFAGISDIASKKYTGVFPSADVGGASDLMDKQLQTDIAFRAIADHLRMAAFSITDGAVPSNKKRGAVLRSVIRRAVRFGYQVLDIREPFMHKLVPIVTASMGDAFPELRGSAERTATILKEEEEAFLSVIDRGLRVFDDAADAAAKRPGKVFLGSDIFNLHATLGFPSDMTMQLARERELTPDQPEYEKLWEQHVQISRSDKKHIQVAVDLTQFAKTDDSHKYHGMTTEGTIIGWIANDQAVNAGRLEEDQVAALLLDRTTFYAEQGGQIGDIGIIQSSTGRFEVTATERKGEHVLHIGQVLEGHIQAHQQCEVQVDIRRSDTMRNHTTTHLLNWALRRVLGGHIDQKGSLVDNDKLRFDFSHSQALSSEETAQVERLVNEKIYSNVSVSATVMALADAKTMPGVRAMFGEKYPDPVRVIAIGTTDPRQHAGAEYSIEFCGGTHLSSTGQAGFFKIIGEEAIAKGVRRITAVTGRAAVEYMQQVESQIAAVQQALGVGIADAPKRIVALQDDIKTLRKKLAAGAGLGVDPIVAAGKLLDAAPTLGPGKLIVGEIPGATPEQLLQAMDSLKKKATSYAVLIASVSDEKVNLVAACSDDLIKAGLKAGDWIREAAKVTGGGGGGRPQMAQAGGKDPTKLNEALDVARAFAEQNVK